MKFDSKAFGKAIAKTMEAREMTGVRQAAKESKTDKTSLAKYIRAERIPDIPRFLKLCAWMKVDPKQFFKTK